MSQHPKDEEATGSWMIVRILGFSIERDEK